MLLQTVVSGYNNMDYGISGQWNESGAKPRNRSDNVISPTFSFYTEQAIKTFRRTTAGTYPLRLHGIDAWRHSPCMMEISSGCYKASSTG